MTPVWTAQALDDVSAIVTRIGQDDPQATTQLLDRIEETATTILPANPLMGRPGRVDGTREFLLHRSYILVYRVQADRLDILTVRHAARSWPGRL